MTIEELGLAGLVFIVVLIGLVLGGVGRHSRKETEFVKLEDALGQTLSNGASCHENINSGNGTYFNEYLREWMPISDVIGAYAEMHKADSRTVGFDVKAFHEQLATLHTLDQPVQTVVGRRMANGTGLYDEPDVDGWLKQAHDRMSK